jgi:hypothetical protein
MIYVQIASYRDPELIQTLRDLFGKASDPKNIRVGVAFQYDENDRLSEFVSDPRVDVVHIPHQDSLGCCWARSILNNKYNGEEYTLQLDSHHRFAQGWDTTCIEMLESLPGKPVLTTYLPSYNPESDYRIENAWCMEIDPNQPKDIPCFRPYYSDHKKPKPTYLFSAHFVFTRGQFIRDVPYDSELYFHGEEITMAARAYCAGYDLYHPHKVVAWHEYTRNGRRKQWDDDQEWWKKDVSSKERVKKILSGVIPIDRERTLAEYKQLIGI